MPQTRSSLRDPDNGDPSPASHLAVALLADDLLVSPSRHRLTGVKEITVGRGESASRRRVGNALALTLPDAWLSERHARLRPVLHRWAIEDLGSRNGTFVNGTRVREIMLADGDVIEVGHTFLVFRVAVPDDGDDDVEVALPDGPEPGVPTLSPALARQMAQLTRVARSREPVLIGGETGTGKEVVARALHRLSERPGEFVAVNCGALPETLAEAELFGHRRGAFSGAVAERPGYVRAAEGGTLFLDEVADLRPPSQAALLRVLQERQVVPLGAERPLAVDVRICSATHGSLADSDRFRPDLLARLRGLELQLPPLRARMEDLGLLLQALLRRRQQPARFKVAALRALFAHAWPENVRELDQVVGSALALSDGAPIDRTHLPARVGAGPAAGADRQRPLQAEELTHRGELVRLLREHQGNIAAVSRATGKGRQQIHRWLRRYELDASTFRR